MKTPTLKIPKFKSTKAKINRQDTRHGKMDLSNTSPGKYLSKAKGGKVK